MCSSLDVAETFEKLHRDVLRDIRNPDCSVNFGKRNFALTSYADEQGKTRPYCLITRDGSTFLVMGYRGEKATRFKEAYITQFNHIEQALRRKQLQREAFKPSHRSLTDAIQAANGNIWAYKLFTDLDYKSVTGRTAAQARRR